MVISARRQRSLDRRMRKVHIESQLQSIRLVNLDAKIIGYPGGHPKYRYCYEFSNGKKIVQFVRSENRARKAALEKE